jgi:hypothetical protein
MVPPQEQKDQTANHSTHLAVGVVAAFVGKSRVEKKNCPSHSKRWMLFGQQRVWAKKCWRQCYQTNFQSAR